MLLARSELFHLLGNSIAIMPDQSTICTWILPSSDGGSSVRAVLRWEADEQILEANVVELSMNGDSTQLVWVHGEYNMEEDVFDVVGRDDTGEASDDSDPRAAAVAFRKQVAAIEAAASGLVLQEN